MDIVYLNGTASVLQTQKLYNYLDVMYRSQIFVGELQL
jgi:hypothetical protein